jgi:hypothetical protein
MGEPITIYNKDGKRVTVYGVNQMNEELGRGAVAENPNPDAAPLPEDFPAAALLSAGGYVNLDALEAADDDALLSVSGIGDKTLAEIRAALKSQRAPKQSPADKLEEKIMKGKVK